MIMINTIRKFWSRLIEVARLAQRGKDELQRQPPWDFPNHRPRGKQPSPRSVNGAEDDQPKNIGQGGAGA